MKKYENFVSALRNLEAVYQYEPPYDNVILTGLVGLYEVCFEQSWKAMKETLEKNGFAESQTGSPRQIVKTAYQAGMIKEEDVWLEALISRNNVAHAYNQDVALDIINATRMRYFDMFQNLKEVLDKEWKE
ncbi:MAG: HI0074 family nucleotidyltransferase substrate-binding subunit [Eubacteriales bacterium]|nr:HI0074 family nucleotidyltransferase substrate-binding subunit [Eubacteriales bacterium]